MKSTKLTDRAKALKVASAGEESFRARDAVEHIRTAFNSLARESAPLDRRPDGEDLPSVDV